MNRRLAHGLRSVLLASVAGVMSATLLAPTPAVAQGAKTRKDEKTYKQVAHVKIEIKQESGKVIKNDGQVDWGADGRIELPGDKHLHAVSLKVARVQDNGTKVSITMGYDQDGESVIAPYTFDTKVKKREVIQIEGGIAIAVQVTSKKVAVDAPPPEEKPNDRDEKLEIGGDTDDPLGGLK